MVYDELYTNLDIFSLSNSEMLTLLMYRGY